MDPEKEETREVEQEEEETREVSGRMMRARKSVRYAT